MIITNINYQNRYQALRAAKFLNLNLNKVLFVLDSSHSRLNLSDLVFTSTPIIRRGWSEWGRNIWSRSEVSFELQIYCRNSEKILFAQNLMDTLMPELEFLFYNDLIKSTRIWMKYFKSYIFDHDKFLKKYSQPVNFMELYKFAPELLVEVPYLLDLSERPFVYLWQDKINPEAPCVLLGERKFEQIKSDYFFCLDSGYFGQLGELIKYQAERGLKPKILFDQIKYFGGQ